MWEFIHIHIDTIALWVIVSMFGALIYFIKRLIRSFDKMETAVQELKEAVIEHRVVSDSHERRIILLEDNVFKVH